MQPNKNLALRQAKGFFQRYNTVLASEFRVACEEGCAEIDTLAKTVESVSDMKAYRAVYAELKRGYGSICDEFDSIIMQQKQNKTTGSVKGADLMDDSVLQFHNDNLELVTHDELEYQIRLESAYTQVRRAYEALLFEAGMDATGRSFVGENPIASDMEHLRPGRQALLIQHLFDAKFREPFVARIAFRFLGCRFFASVGTEYKNWSGDVKQIAKSLDLKPSLTLAPLGGGSGGGAELVQGVPAVPLMPASKIQEGMVTVSEELLEKVNLLLDNISKVDIPAALEATTNPPPSLSDTGVVPEGSTVETVDTKALNKLLEKMQHVELESASELVKDDQGAEAPEDIRQVLKNALTNMSDENIMTVIDRVSENIINLVCHLFRNITDNQALHPEAGFQISRVQLPIMRLALTDSTMFRNESHPARTYINNLGRLGFNVTESGDEYLIAIKRSVDDLLRKFTGDASVFHQLNDFLEPYTLPLICQQSEQDGEHSDRLITPEQVQEFLDNQQSRIIREFLLHRFAKIAWESLLSRIFHQSGINSKQWRVATAAYAAVVWSTQIDVHQESDKRQVLRRIPKIVVDVKALFKQYQLSDGVCDTILTMMYDIHKQILQGVPLRDIVDADDDAVGHNSGPVVIDVKPSASTLLDENSEERSAEKADKKRDGAFKERVDTKGKSKSQDPFEDAEIIEVEMIDVAPSGDALDAEAEPPSVSHLSLSGGARADASKGGAKAGGESAVGLEQGDGQSAQLPMNLSEVDEMIHRYKVGEVFELLGERGQSKRYQLSHVSNVLGVYYFREFGSKSLLEVARPDLVILTLQQTLKKLSGASVFDDSLESVLTRIREHQEMDNQGPAVA